MIKPQGKLNEWMVAFPQNKPRAAWEGSGPSLTPSYWGRDPVSEVKFLTEFPRGRAKLTARSDSKSRDCASVLGCSAVPFGVFVLGAWPW